MKPIHLVTGAAGFLGKAIIRKLLDEGKMVRAFVRRSDPDLSAWNVEMTQGDLTDPKAVENAVQECELVFHVAAKAGIWGETKDFYQSNVIGTQNVINACQNQHVRKLVYTSSPSVIFDGHDQEGVNESVPYPHYFLADYPRTKAQAEQLVLSANGPSFATVSLRPHLIWGPGDRHLVPRILSRGRAGKLRRIGKRNPLIDSVYIDNAVHAHLLAADRLNPNANIAGKVYFISNGEPWPLWDLVNAILTAGNVPIVRKSVPTWLAHMLGSGCEILYRLLRKQNDPPMTRFLAKELSTAHWFDIQASRRDLGYEPLVSMKEGLQRLRAYLNHQKPHEVP